MGNKLLYTDPDTGETNEIRADPAAVNASLYYIPEPYTYPHIPNYFDTSNITFGGSITTNKNLTKALLVAIRNIENPTKNTKNPFLKNNYADIVSVLDACKKELLDAGVILLQGSRPNALNPQWVDVYTKLIHGETGEEIETTVVMQPKEPNPQGFAGLLTYGRRYGLFAALGLAAVDDDDDGNVASGTTGAAALARPVRK